MKFRIHFLMICLLLCLASGATASGDCDPNDGNNSRKDATPIGYKGSANGVVCPDDPYDFYVLRIAEGDTVSGSISFSSRQVSTVLHIGQAESGRMLVDGKATTEGCLGFTIDVPAGKLPPGTYYARVSFESGADYDHDYTLSIDLANITRAEFDDKFVTGKAPELNLNQKLPSIPIQPWPMYRGDARRTGRSYFPGPAALSKVELVADFYNEFVPGGHTENPSLRWVIFQGPLMRSPDNFYCIAYHKRIEEIGSTAVYDGYYTMLYELSSGKLRKIGGNLSMETCLDTIGDIFRTSPLSLGKCDFTLDDFDSVWNSDIPHDDTVNYKEGYRYLTNLVGTRLYLHRGLINGPFYITAFEHGGEVAWHSKKFDHPMIGMMEDTNGNFYVRVINEGLYKVGLDGKILWNVLGQPQMQKPTGLAPADKSGRVGPICGDDGRIWVSTRTLASLPTEYHVFNPDGFLYKSGNFGAAINPLVCCYGHDRRFYVATNTIEIRCYNDWDQMVWSTPLVDPNNITGPISIQDMVMDSKNMIYVLMKRGVLDANTSIIELFAINPNGEIVSSTTINLPAGAGPGNELAIGDDKKLVLLNSGGFLYVISTLEMDPGILNGGFHLEAIDN